MIRLANITAGYTSAPHVLDNLSFSFLENGTYALMGTSGIGKTTLLRVMAGLTPLTSGTVEGVFDKRTVMLFQEDRLLPWYTVLDNVLLGMEHPDRTKATAILRALDIGDSGAHLPGRLSGGMQRRAALARAIGYGASILLMDEPFAGVDEQTVKRIAPYVQASAPFILFTTHAASEAQAMDATIVELTNGSTLVGRNAAPPGNSLSTIGNRV